MSYPPIKPFGVVYCLDVLWWGISIGGHHYTGKITYYDAAGKWHSHELERDLSLKDAKLLDPDSAERRWRLGGVFRKSNRFETRPQLDRWAARWVKADALKCGASTWLLIEHDTCNPRRPIASQGWDKNRLKLMTDIAEMWDKVPNWARTGMPSLWDAVYGTWGQLVAEAGPLETLPTLRRLSREMKTLVDQIVAKR